MISIAVAGGSGPVGKTIVDALLASGQFVVHVLSRQDQPSSGKLHFLRVDYDDPVHTSKAFEAAGVSTVICAIGVATPSTNQAQRNLIRACALATTVKRFVISSFDMLHRNEDINISPLARYTFEAINDLEKTDLEYTRIANGWFLDYYGMPHWKTYLHPWINVLNMEKKWAVIPGDGTAKANFITTQDMAKFVARLMELQRWTPVSSIVGHEISFQDLLQLAEKVTGVKFRVAHDSLDRLRGGNISFFSEFPPIDFLDNAEAFYATIHYQAGIGRYLVPTENILDTKFPDIHLTTAAEVMEISWGKSAALG